MTKKRIYAAILAIMLMMPFCIYANEGVSAENGLIPEVYDDCIDFSRCIDHSDGLYAYTVPEEDYYAFDEDHTMLRRSENTREWLMYKTKADRYPVFNTYFRYTADIPHFDFEASEDGENWHKIRPNMKISSVESWKWIPVTYSLRSILPSDKYVKIIYSDKSDEAWTPMLASVDYEFYKTDIGFADCIGTPYESAAAMLKAFGFADGVNEYEFMPEETLNRAALAQFIAKIICLSDSGRGEMVFSDVPQRHWASAAVAALYGQGIIQGDETGQFKPDAPVTYTEAAKMLVCALGYTSEIEKLGGYPNGVRTVAARIGLLNGNENGDVPITRGDAALMICRALKAEPFRQTLFGDNSEFNRGETLLAAYHEIDTVDGVVTSVGGMSIVSEIIADKSEIVIDGIRYECKGNYDILLGRNVEAYVKDDKLLYAEPKHSTILEVSADRYLYIKDGRIYYDGGDDKPRSVNVTANTRIVYNGRYKDRIGTTNGLKINSGSICFIKNGGNSADTVIIWDYKNYIAANSAPLSKGVTNRLDGGVFGIPESADRLDISVYGENCEIEDAYVRRNDVISAALSEDGTVMRIAITNTYVDGIFSSVNDNEIKIEDYSVKLAKDFRYIGDKPKIGAKVCLFTDINGRAFSAEAEGVYTYAYLQSPDTADAFGRSVALRLISEDGAAEIYIADESTRLNGTAHRTADIASLPPQLIRLKINNGRISEILTSDEASEFELGFSSSSCKYYGGQLCVFASIYRLGPETPVFVIPENETQINEYKVKSRNWLNTDFEYNIKLYNVSEEYTVGAAVIYINGSRRREVKPYDKIAFIRDCSQINNADGEACLKLSVYSGGTEEAVYFDNEGGTDDTNGWLPGYTPRDTSNGNCVFNGGEVIQQYSDDESHCKSFRMLLTSKMIEDQILYESNTGDYGALSDNNYFSELYTAFAKVYGRYNNKILFSAEAGNKRLRTAVLDTARVYVLNKRLKTIEVGDASDIRTGDLVFVRMSYGETTDIIVVQNV